MSQSLYEEAIAEARRLTEMAEQNAKNKIIDAVTPQIKRLIEQELMGGDDDLEMDDPESDEGEGEDEAPEAALDLDALMAPAPEPAPVTPAPSAAPSLKMDGGEIEITVGGTKIEIEPAEGEEGEEGDELLLDEPVMEALERMVAESRRGRSALLKRLQRLSERTALLRQAMTEARKVGTRSQKRRLAQVFEGLAREAVALRKQVVLAESSTGGRTPETKLINSIIKEMKDMSRRNGKNVFDFLFEAEEGEEKDVEMDMDMDEDKSDDVDVDAVKDAVEDLAAALGMSVSSEEEEGEEAEEEEEEGEEEAVLELEADMPEGAYMEMDEMDEMEEGDKMEETVYELDESVLRKALASMRRARGRRLNEEAVDAAESFGGGDAGDEMFVDVDEETLLNVLADELGAAKAPKVGGAELAQESRRRRAALSEATKLRRQVADYRKVAEQLKGQLTEMNLFNAKLLYANKLMQNRDLSAKQQRAIVEALDNAKTLREAKLLYKSLTESLNKGANKGALSEGRTRVLGSSSKSARSAQPINEAGGTDRWALLAGIKKD